MIRLVATLIIMLSCLKVVAQQDPLISHLFYNKIYVNPAFAGQQEEICTNIVYRNQWAGIEGAPTSTLFSLDAPLQLFGKKHGVGLLISNETLGFEKNFLGSLQYAYTHHLQTGSLSFGLKLGLYNKAYDAAWQTPDGGNGSNDVAIPMAKDQSMTYDLGLGIVYNLNNLYVGFSTVHLTQPKFKFATSDIPFLKRHYYLISGYKIMLPNSSFELTPNLLLAFDGSSRQITTNVNLLYNKKVWGGVTYRTLNSLDINIGTELFNGIKIGYAYGLNLSKLIKTNSGSHEIMISYCFNLGIEKIPQKYRSVRFL
jgi:type IX secretion system PorP/SprF family membrane protein